MRIATGKYANCVVPRGYGARFAVTSTASSTVSIPPKSSACRRYFDDLTGTIFERKKNAAKDDATASKGHADAAHWRRRNPRSSA